MIDVTKLRDDVAAAGPEMRVSQQQMLTLAAAIERGQDAERELRRIRMIGAVAAIGSGE